MELKYYINHLIPKQIPVCDIVGGVLIDVELTSEILPGSVNITYTLTSSSILNEDSTNTIEYLSKWEPEASVITTPCSLSLSL